MDHDYFYFKNEYDNICVSLSSVNTIFNAGLNFNYYLLVISAVDC